MTIQPAPSAYGKIASWRYIWASAMHNCWFICLPMLIVLSHRNIVGAMVLMVVAGSFAMPGFWPAAGRLFRPVSWRPGTGSAVLAIFLLLCLYIFISVIWTPLKSESEWALSLTLFFLISGGFLWTVMALPVHFVRIVSWILLGAGLVAILSIGIEAMTGGGIRDLIPPYGRADKDIIAAARGTTIGLMLLPGLLLLAWQLVPPPGDRPAWWYLAGGIAGAACLGAGATIFGVSANLGALLAIPAAGGIALWRPKPALYLTAGVWAAAFVLAPFAGLFLPSIEAIEAMEGGPVSWIQRLAIWRFAVDNIFSGPLSFLFGGGVNYSQYLNDLGRTITLSGYPEPIPLLPTHPHNLFLQIWLEFGLAGVALVLAALWLMVRLALALPARVLTPPVTAAVLALGAAFFVICAVDLSLWTPWRLAAPVYGLYAIIAASRISATKVSR